MTRFTLSISLFGLLNQRGGAALSQVLPHVSVEIPTGLRPQEVAGEPVIIPLLPLEGWWWWEGGIQYKK